MIRGPWPCKACGTHDCRCAVCGRPCAFPCARPGHKYEPTRERRAASEERHALTEAPNEETGR